MEKEIKFLPEGYRYLDLGESIQTNDYFWNQEKSKWIRIQHDADTSNWIKEHLIRKINEKR